MLTILITIITGHYLKNKIKALSPPESLASISADGVCCAHTASCSQCFLLSVLGSRRARKDRAFVTPAIHYLLSLVCLLNSPVFSATPGLVSFPKASGFALLSREKMAARAAGGQAAEPLVYFGVTGLEKMLWQNESVFRRLLVCGISGITV